MPEGLYYAMAQAVRPSEPAFRTYGLIFCMKTVGKLIEGVLGLLWVFVSSNTHLYQQNSSQYTVLARPVRPSVR